MTVTPTAGIAATWSAAKPNPSAQAVQANSQRQAKAGETPPQEPAKGPPAPEGQGTRVDVRV